MSLLNKLIKDSIHKIRSFKNKNRPYVAVTVQGVHYDALFDTGADITCMSEKAFRQIPIHRRPKKIGNVAAPTSASQTAMPAKGKFEMTMVIDNKKFTVPVIE